jgi:hypothetical protein
MIKIKEVVRIESQRRTAWYKIYAVYMTIRAFKQKTYEKIWQKHNFYFVILMVNRLKCKLKMRIRKRG